MEYHCEYSTYNSHHKVLVNLQASNMDALKSCVLFSQMCVFAFVAIDGAGSRLHFLHSFNSGCYHHSTMETRWLYCVECPQYSTRRRSPSNIHRTWAEAYLHTKWHPNPPNRLATMHQRWFKDRTDNVADKRSPRTVKVPAVQWNIEIHLFCFTANSENVH